MPHISQEELNKLNGAPSTGLPFDRIKEFTDKPAVLVPRNTLLLGVGGIAAMLLLTWPVLIVSFILGAATVVKFGCPCGDNKEDKK